MLAQRGADEVQQRFPLVERADSRAVRDQVVGDGGLRGALHHASWIVLGQRLVDVLEVDVVDGLVGESDRSVSASASPTSRSTASARKNPSSWQAPVGRRGRRDSAQPVPIPHRCRGRRSDSDRCRSGLEATCGRDVAGVLMHSSLKSVIRDCTSGSYHPVVNVLAIENYGEQTRSSATGPRRPVADEPHLPLVRAAAGGAGQGQPGDHRVAVEHRRRPRRTRRR